MLNTVFSVTIPANDHIIKLEGRVLALHHTDFGQRVTLFVPGLGSKEVTLITKVPLLLNDRFLVSAYAWGLPNFNPESVYFLKTKPEERILGPINEIPFLSSKLSEFSVITNFTSVTARLNVRASIFPRGRGAFFFVYSSGFSFFLPRRMHRTLRNRLVGFRGLGAFLSFFSALQGGNYPFVMLQSGIARPDIQFVCFYSLLSVFFRAFSFISPRRLKRRILFGYKDVVSVYTKSSISSSALLLTSAFVGYRMFMLIFWSGFVACPLTFWSANSLLKSQAVLRKPTSSFLHYSKFAFQYAPQEPIKGHSPVLRPAQLSKETVKAAYIIHQRSSSKVTGK